MAIWVESKLRDSSSLKGLFIFLEWSIRGWKKNEGRNQQQRKVGRGKDGHKERNRERPSSLRKDSSYWPVFVQYIQDVLGEEQSLSLSFKIEKKKKDVLEEGDTVNRDEF